MTVPAGIESPPPTSRIKLLSFPVLAPGKCAFCGSADDDRSYIDFGMQLDWYGAVYFCSFCIIEVSEAVGMVPAKKLNELRSQFNEFKSSNDELIRKYADLKNAVRHVLSGSSGDEPSGDIILSVSNPSADEESEGSNQGHEGGSEVNDETSSVTRRRSVRRP